MLLRTEKAMIGSVPRRAYLVLFSLASLISGLLLFLFLAIPPDANLVIPEPFSHAPPLPPPSVGKNIPTGPALVQAGREQAPTASSPASAYHNTKGAGEAKEKEEGKEEGTETKKEKEKAKNFKSQHKGKGKGKGKGKSNGSDEGEAKEVKYFHEAGDGNGLVHYDRRFFIDEVSYEEHLEHLRFLIRSYLLFANEKGIETWIAHGTLLGWWWNQRIMPWDYDLDVQVKSEALATMGDSYNMTLHSFTLDDLGVEPEDDGGKGRREDMMRKKRGKPNKLYVLDVNPNSVHRSHMEGLNVIDARWVDVDNGMFIDITGLTELEPDGKPGVLSCKNNHHYKLDDLYPLQESAFEGVKVMVPRGAEGMLSEEYGPECLQRTAWEGHLWDSEQREWAKRG